MDVEEAEVKTVMSLERETARCLDHQRMRGNSSRWVDDSKKG